MPDSSTTENEPPEKHPYTWLIRPCELYKAEYKECTSIRGRFHQYFVFGEFLNCTQWKIDYDNCYLWNKYKNETAYKDLVNSERTRRFIRLQGHYTNDVWEKRETRPPENWNTPLPDWIEEKNKNSFLKIASEKLKSEKSEVIAKNSCTIL
ncbi:UPF0545 protein C22orf39 homolog [Ceratina calcarata]|uniref:Synaptic plasticity regulator PANTS n=1 Tax=Ceratina calcarata TaxID=156304 RepID=A0AAJ7N8R4_9HYME|nr:UPF0545 protein C22orf39 homolog [Ceratina calcarata]